MLMDVSFKEIPFPLLMLSPVGLAAAESTARGEV